MTPASWVPEKGRLASEERDGCVRELNRGRCADMWVSPQSNSDISASEYVNFSDILYVRKSE